MARRKLPAIPAEDKRTVGALLRGLRRAAGYRAVADAAAADGCPASQPTIYQYERGAMTPSLQQFLELVEFYALRDHRHGGGDRKATEDLRAQAVAAIARALTLRVYRVSDAHALMARLQPPLPRGRGDA